MDRLAELPAQPKQADEQEVKQPKKPKQSLFWKKTSERKQETQVEEPKQDSRFDGISRWEQQINECLQTLQQASDTLDQLHADMQRFADEETRRKQNSRVASQTRIVKEAAGVAKNKIAAVKAQLAEQDYIDEVAGAILHQQQRALYDLIQRIQQQLRLIADLDKAKRRRDFEIRAGSRMTADEIDRAVQAGQEPPSMAEELMRSDHLTHLRQTVEDIEDRHSDILVLERQVIEINELFQSLAFLVDKQQDSLDVIAHRIDNAKHYTTRGEGELVIAEQNQKKSRKRTCCLVVILLAVLIVVVAPILATQLRRA